MSGPVTFATGWKLLQPEDALQLISNDPLGSKTIDGRPVGLALEGNLSFGGTDGGQLAINARGGFSVAILNDPTDVDEDGILAASAAATPEGALPPQLMFDSDVAYIKLRAEAGVKAAAEVPLASLLSIEAGAEASAIFADYRAHSPAEQARAAFLLDISKPARFVTSLSHVQSLAAGEALAFRFAGRLSADVTVSWSDVFTGQIGTLSALLGTAAPIAISVNAGASVALSVSVSDDFLIVFSRVGDSRWRVGLKKVKSSRVAPSLDAGIDVGFENPAQLKALALAALEGVLGAPLAKVNVILDAASLESLGTIERRLAKFLIDRLGLEDELATIEGLRDRIRELEAKITGVLDKVVTTRIALSFAYEYNRLSVDTNLLQATLSADALQALHAALIKGKAESVVRSVREQQKGIELELYLNQKEITRTHAWGFTLGFGKWATIGGRDFKKVSTVRRSDVHNRIQESYLGARSYTGTWIGETTEWGVDLKADMKDYSAEPLVSDFSFGIHLLWSIEQKSLSGQELEAYLDAGVIWRVLREQDLTEVRARLAAALDAEAILNIQMTIPNGVVRAMLPALAGSDVDTFAPALAVAMPWMNVSDARRRAARRRQLYAPLWALYLAKPELTQADFARAAERHVRKAGHTELILTESTPTGPNPFSFAGLTHINGDTRGACEKFVRGCGILHTSINAGARNQKTIDKAVGDMDDLWTQSHHVRAIGAHLLDVAERAGVLADVTRTMTIESEPLGGAVVVTA